MMDAITVVTAILVLITGYYARQTREMVTEMKKARADQFHPSLRIIPIKVFRKIGDKSYYSLGAKIINVGIGPAIITEIKIKLEPNGIEKKIPSIHLYPRQEYYLLNEFESSENYENIKKFEKITFSAKFKDILDIPHDRDYIFNINNDFDKFENDDREHKNPFY